MHNAILPPNPMEELEQNKKQAENKESKKKLYDLDKQKKDEERKQREKTKVTKGVFKKVILWIIALGVLALIVWAIASGPKTPQEDIISRSGIHWHPTLSILINEEPQEISGNIGITGVHRPQSIHTHSPDGVIHVEFSGTVRQDKIRLKEFFRVWRKDFNSECIFDFCNGEEGTVKMLVNGEENFDFENYLMQDGDRIEIRYE